MSLDNAGAQRAGGNPLQAEKPAKRGTLTDWMRLRLRGIVEPMAAFCLRLGLRPNTMTVLGLLGTALGAVFLALGQMTVGGLLILFSGWFDGLDGAMARQMNQPTRFGAFIDSVTDRWSELAIFLGLLVYYLRQPPPQSTLYCILVFVATMGSLMVSYTKSRAETLGFDCNVGLLTRVERYLVMAPALVFNLPWLALWIIAILANFTALQRAWYVRQQARGKPHAQG
jgi:CDP-diacylglycerol--glycerol-3-phosphate 3-phosphatidyltransferase